MIDRIQAIRAGLHDAGHDAFFSLSAGANRYLANFIGTTSCVLITPNEAFFLCDFRYTEKAQRVVADYTVKEVSGSLPVRLGEHLNALGVSRAAFDPSRLTVAEHSAIAEVFVGGALIADNDLVTRVQMIKSAGEIARIREASQLKESVVARIIDGLKEGDTERSVAARLEYELKSAGADALSFDPIVAFGENSAMPHYMPGGRRLAKGDVVLIDCGCEKNGYCSDWTRTFAFGSIPGSWFEAIYDVTRKAQEGALEAIQAGKGCREVDAIARDIITEAGYGPRFGHGLGHGIGVEVHEAPRMNPTASETLQAGMAITVEPGIYLPGQGGVRIEDLVIVTEDGCDVLTKYSNDLRVIPA